MNSCYVDCCTKALPTWCASTMARRLTSLFQCLILLAGISSGTVARGATWPEDETSEQRYWKKVHQQEAQKKKAAERKLKDQRAAGKAELSKLLRGSATPQRQIIIAQDGAPPVPRPSFLAGKGDYVLVSTLFVLVAGLMVGTLVRHRREAEIRALSPAYLSDGIEAAHFEMPQLFQMPVLAPGNPLEPLKGGAARPAVVVESPAVAFFAEAPERLAQIRTVLAELGRTTDDAARRGVLLRIHELVSALKSKADCWDLRPVWQLTSALELLLQRLSEKCKEATPSTLRTIANAVDLLGEISVPGVRPDLIIQPPISVLAVDDDPLCLRAVVFALQKAEMIPALAADGEKAVALATKKPYDVIFMDIQMPGIDGLAAARKIREIEKNETTPVVFITVQSDFHTRAKSSLMGGTDLMAKPFLMFEITVKALMLAMRKRLQLAASCDRQVDGFARSIVPSLRFCGQRSPNTREKLLRKEDAGKSPLKNSNGQMT
jgi:CheY-like chemotaxis protein